MKAVGRWKRRQHLNLMRYELGQEQSIGKRLVTYCLVVKKMEKKTTETQKVGTRLSEEDKWCGQLPCTCVSRSYDVDNHGEKEL